MTKVSTAPDFIIRMVQSEADIIAVRQLLEAYAIGTGIDLGFQRFAEELADLPGPYAPPSGALLLAQSTSDNSVVGCVAMRPFQTTAMGSSRDSSITHPQCRRCEFKRFYLVPGARSTGLAELLARKIIQLAVELGYQEALIDTLPSMTAAVRLYFKLGFYEIPAYYETPIPGIRFMKLDLWKTKQLPAKL
jgi:ribosomal protein S18 acetylase RimI-like enzyme